MATATAENLLTRYDGPRTRRVVGIADMIVSADPRDVIVTYALGSCLGVCVFDPVAGVAGMLHLMLPQGSMSPDKAAQNPLMFADTGIPKLFLGDLASPRVIATMDAELGDAFDATARVRLDEGLVCASISLELSAAGAA